MTQEKIKNRWIIVIGALLIQLCLGAVYVWSVYNTPLTNKFYTLEHPGVVIDKTVTDSAPYKALNDDVKQTFSITIFMFALSTIFAGKAQDKIGPRWVATAGAVMLGLGVFLASKATSVTQLWLFYGILGGFGIGTAYVCPLATCLKWFPDKRGLITGLAVGGFGAASVIFTPVSEALLKSFSVDQAFMILSIIYIVVVALGSQLLEVPPAGYKPAGWNPPAPAAGSKGGQDFTTGQMVKTFQFYVIWLMYLFGAAAGLMLIGNAKNLGTDFAGMDTATAALIVMVIGIFNAAGRLVWGIVSDKLGRVNTLIILYAGTALTFVYLGMGSINATIFMIAACAIAFCFGGFLAVFPSLNAEYYGTANVGTNYGIIFFAYGLGAVLGMKMLAILATTKTPQQAFVAVAILAAVGMGMCFLIRKPPQLNA